MRLAPGASARITLSTLIASSRDEALALADEYNNPATFERAATLAWTQAQVQLHHLGIDPDEAYLFQELASQVLYSDSTLRPSSAILARNTRGASALWRYGISGDLPIVLVRIDAAEDQGIVRQLLRAHEYWRMKQLAVDLVILNEQAPSYGQDLHAALEAQVRTSQSRLGDDGHEPDGRVFILRADLITAEDRSLLQATARAVLLSHRGTLAEQVVRQPRSEAASVPLPRQLPAVQLLDAPPPRPAIEFYNGLGGFTADGREYVIILGERQWTPAPWINVIANPSFGFQVSESGSGYTWSLNSRENQLTPWSNDPVSDPPGESIYVRDEDTGELWSPSVLPIREEAFALYRPARPGLQPVRTQLKRGLARPAAVRAPRGPDQDFPAHHRESLGPIKTLFRDGVCRVGARRFAERLRALRCHRDRHGNRGDARAQRLEQ